MTATSAWPVLDFVLRGQPFDRATNIAVGLATMSAFASASELSHVLREWRNTRRARNPA